MTLISILEKSYTHAFDMVKFGETKNTALIAFNGAIIVGMTKVMHDTSLAVVCYLALFVIIMCSISLFIGFSALIAKLKHNPNEISLPRNNNLLYFATMAHLDEKELIEKLKSSYNLKSENEKYELDMAKQVVITSQIASRKFKLFNLAIAFTFCGIASPISIIIYKLFLDHDK